MRTLKVLLDKLAFPEGPRWHDGKLYFSDMHAHKVIAVDMNGKTETICEVPNRPSGLGWLPDGTDAGGVDDRSQADAPGSRRPQAARGPQQARGMGLQRHGGR